MELFKKYKIEAVRPLTMPAYEYYNYAENDFPNTKQMILKALCVPLYPSLTKKETESIGQLIANIR